jgi:hypothetical protein
VKNVMNRYFIIFHCLIHHENLCAKSIKMTNIVTLVSIPVNFVMSEEMDHRQLKDLLSDMEYEYEDSLCYRKLVQSRCNA